MRTTRQPWYDAEEDDLLPLNVELAADPGRGRWQSDVRRPQWSWPFSWSMVGELLKLLAWGLVISLLAYLIYQLAQTYLRLNPVRTDPRAEGLDSDGQLSDEQRIENLPVDLQTAKADFLTIARAQYESGNFSEAIVYLFSHRLLQLDKAGFIRLMKGKTNRQYLFELHGSGELQRLLGQTMSAFEDVFFGNHDLDRDQFESCWNHNQQFQQLVKQATE